jgi:hypothetical protein
MTSALVQSLVAGGFGLGGTMVGGGLLMLNARHARNDRREEERKSRERGVAAETLEGIGKAIQATYDLRWATFNLVEAKKADAPERLQSSIAEYDRVGSAFGTASLLCVGLAAQIHDDGTQIAALELVGKITAAGNAMAPAHTDGIWEERARPYLEEMGKAYPPVAQALGETIRR